LVGGVWSVFTWLRIGIFGGLLWMRWWTFGFWRNGVSKLCDTYQSLLIRWGKLTQTRVFPTQHQTWLSAPHLQELRHGYLTCGI
jgi:hypothetical protein